jgi:signal transduction histidine kinase
VTWPQPARAALVLTVLGLFVSAQVQIWSAPSSYDVGGRPLNALVAAAFTLPVLAARTWPGSVMLVVLAAIAADHLLGGQHGEPWFTVLLAVYALGSYGSAWASGVGLFVLAALVLSMDIPRLQRGDPVDEVLPAWFILGALWGLGRWMRHRRAELGDLSSRAEALERDRDEATRAAIAHERARIARELHDLVAHSLAVIVLQAQAADRVLTTDVEAARRALAAIDSTGREGLGELRRMLDILVDTAPDDLEPRPSLDHLDLLVDRVRNAGLAVSVSVSGQPRPLPVGVDLSAYRIVQEALTNTLKHGSPTNVEVGVDYRPDGLELTIADEGNGRQRPGAQQGSGHGLIGMRERAHLYGGTVEAGPTPAGGFLVRAVLPTAAS